MADFFRFSDGMPKKDDKNVIANTSRRVKASSREAIHDLLAGGVLGYILLWLLPVWLSSLVMLTVTVLFLSSFIAPYVADKRPRKKVPIANKAVLITGCDSGFGNMLATKMDDLGFNVFACCLFPEAEAAKKLKQFASSRMHVLGMDVSKDEDVQKALDYVKENLGSNKLWAVVCNAGLNDGGEVLLTGMSTFKYVVDVNFLGTVRVIKAFLPLLCKSKGRVIAMASAGGRYPTAGMAAYCSSKASVISFCNSLRAELYKFGVQVVTMEPWLYRTRMVDHQRVMDMMKKTWDEAPEEVKSLHPPNYLDITMRNARIFLNQATSDDTNEVVMCLQEAITAEHPKLSYSPGKLKLRATFWILGKLPQSVYDWLTLRPSLSEGK